MVRLLVRIGFRFSSRPSMILLQAGTYVNGVNNQNRTGPNSSTNYCAYPKAPLHYTHMDENLLENKCYCCGLLPIWCGAPLTLQLDHINGMRGDHRLENLRLVCPNCHSQTATYAGRRNKLPSQQCKSCNKKISKPSKHCKKCARAITAVKQRTFSVTKEEALELLASNLTLEEIGRRFNVYGNTFKKRCKSLGIDCRKESRKLIREAHQL